MCRIYPYMKNIITLYLTVKYSSSSKEWIFLKEGWGIRDVRGPYLNTFTGHICISNDILLPAVPSTISLTLSLSNRCPTTSILVQASACGKIMTNSIEKNSSREFIFDSVLRKSTRNFDIFVSIPIVKTCAELKKYCDIIAIDEITIERS